MSRYREAAIAIYAMLGIDCSTIIKHFLKLIIFLMDNLYSSIQHRKEYPWDTIDQN